MKVEFIESYIHDEDGGDYKWHDNHGELVRCIACWRYNKRMKHCPFMVVDMEPDGYCSHGAKGDEV